ncbi:hypothetical protein NIES267_52110 [Calothrix parasitica NIES-267]|uniref:Uncharacterized protein n=1 Tax=Calothrix parasitica NIES-267 TaxID=1973488 RepID=A0A1Z4LWY9_9CYAN|nr:hypothetical protein NIES267_52110 [Calothrix parasitica NIES-267]
MEQWQFLIQKEGERAWHPLEKPSIQINEGRYRVVARSNRTNTDVEVRVTHSSPLETPPIRRIQKRIRRINSEGLTVIIPFTYLKSGVWELQCSGDLMSDLLGASWQYTINLTVTPSEVEGKIVLPKKPKHDSDKQKKSVRKNIQKNQAKSKITNIQSSHNSSPVRSRDLKTNDAGLISSISIEGAANKSRGITGKSSSTSPSASKKAALNKAVAENGKEKLRESLEAASEKRKNVSKKPAQKSTQQFTQNKTLSKKPAQKLRDSVKGLPQKAASSSVQKKQSVKNTAKLNQENSQTPAKKSLNENLNEKAVQKPSEKPKAVNKLLEASKSLEPNQKEILEKSPQKADLAIIEQNNDPVRVKGDTAEQILQNLIELALPSSEVLLPDDNIDDTLATPPPLPLQLILSKVNYVASWGETITVEGEVLLKQTTDQRINQISQAELQIELRSPQNSQLLQSFRLPNPNKSIPFAIASLINIPEECSSKLILGEVKLYGILGNSRTIELLAAQSFTITAEIKELLAITVANPKGELEKFAYSEDKLSAQNLEQVSENSVSLDLELFNLVKTSRPEQSLAGVKSTKKSLPLRAEPRKLRRGRMHSPKLPNVPGYQEKIDEYINNGYIETAYISDATGTSFPFLRKLEAIPEPLREIDEEVIEYETPASAYKTVIDNKNNFETVETVETSIEADKTSQAELIVDRLHKDNNLSFEEPITPRNSELIAGENLNTSPLIRQWMQSRGYSLPEPIDVEYEDYDIQVSNQDYQQQASPSPNHEKTENSQTLHQEKAQIEVKPSSPYLSISTSSEWQVSQIAAPSNQIAQEFVVDDTDIFADNILETETSKSDAVDDKAEKSSTLALTINTQKIEELPIPQLYVPQGELISGKSLNVRVRLPLGNSHLAVKLWLEDCQTRILLDGPHLLTNLTPNKNQELEVITKLNIPFGCLEIRLEAVAINRSTQQESHKLTIQRTVIPPDLPNVQLDAILGM